MSLLKKKLTTPPEGCPNGEACLALENDRRQWHLDKSFSVGHLITTLLALGSFIYWAMKQEGRVVTLEQHDVQFQGDIQQLRGEMKTGSDHVTKRLDRIEDKLDRVLEKRR